MVGVQQKRFGVGLDSLRPHFEAEIHVAEIESGRGTCVGLIVRGGDIHSHSVGGDRVFVPLQIGIGIADHDGRSSIIWTKVQALIKHIDRFELPPPFVERSSEPEHQFEIIGIPFDLLFKEHDGLRIPAGIKQGLLVFTFDPSFWLIEGLEETMMHQPNSVV